MNIDLLFVLAAALLGEVRVWPGLLLLAPVPGNEFELMLSRARVA